MNDYSGTGIANDAGLKKDKPDKIVRRVSLGRPIITPRLRHSAISPQGKFSYCKKVAGRSGAYEKIREKTDLSNADRMMSDLPGFVRKVLAQP